MKKILRLSVCVLFLGCNSPGSTVVSGILEDVDDGTIVILSRVNDRGETVVIGSDTVRGNGFLIDLGRTEQPGKVELGIDGSPLPGGMTLWTAPGKTVKVSGSGAWPGSWTATAFTPEHEQWNDYHLQTVGLLKEKGETLNRLEEIFAPGVPPLDERDERDEEAVRLYNILDSLNIQISIIEFGDHGKTAGTVTSRSR